MAGFRVWKLLIVTFCVSSSRALDFSITTTWDSLPVNHEPVNLKLTPVDESSFKLSITAPFFDDPADPGGEGGQPFYGLWDYEVVEMMLLNDANQYMELEFCPWGQQLVLLLNGYRNTTRHSLQLNYTVLNRSPNQWSAEALIPASYLPPNVTKMNAYAIHGSGTDRVYEALYPVPTGSFADPDFHRLNFFQPIDMDQLLPAVVSYSNLWTDSLQGVRQLDITMTWDGQPTGEGVPQLRLSKFDNVTLRLEIAAPLYGDPAAPSGPPGSFWQLWNYEVVELFLLNDRQEYIEMEFGPWGHYIILLLKGYRNTLAANYTITYTVSNNSDTWNGVAHIPLSYLPPQVTKCNAYAIHGSNSNRKYSSLYPVPPGTNITGPDFHLLQHFRALDMDIVAPGTKDGNYSDIWASVLNLTAAGNSTSSGQPTTLPHTSPSQGANLSVNDFLLAMVAVFLSTSKLF